MAEFSKEYLIAVNSSWQPDFSYLEELSELKDDNEVHRICEGFGSFGIKSITDEPYLLFFGAQPKKLSIVIQSMKGKD